MKGEPRKKRMSNHDIALELIVKHPEFMGESGMDALLIIKEPDYFKRRSREQRCCCDGLIIYQDHGVPFEVKRSYNGLGHAMEQMDAGRYIIEHFFNRDVPYLTLVLYGDGLRYERFDK